MKTQRRDKMMIEDKQMSDNKLSNIVFSQLLTLIDNMAEFGVDGESIKEVIEPKILYYKLNDALKNTINDVLNSKIEKEKKEKEKKEENHNENKEENMENKIQENEKEKEENKEDINLIKDDINKQENN